MAKAQTTPSPSLDLDGPSPTPLANDLPRINSVKETIEANGEPGVTLASVARQGDDSRPFCEKHQCMMKANGTGPQVTYYACPVPGCGCKEKKIRPQFKMATEPHVCPQETCREPVQYLEAKERQPLVAVVVMRCPKCGFEIQQPRAQFRPRQYGKDELGAR